ncbi:MAG: SagB/ThcOx family dehydrogenase [Propionibacteriaceae bacterium]|nr:SagB/ThcOx family dehydrogenase [Propionibacteriaceae bacterium]
MSELDRHATNLVDVVYGNEHLAYDDPTENWFEATKVYRASMAWDAPGVSRLLRSPALQQIATRAGKRFDDMPSIALPASADPGFSLFQAAELRRSADRFSGDPIELQQLATILDFGYGLVRRPEGLRRRVPSGGALYPLDVFVLASRVSGLDHGVYHFDPYRDCLAVLGDFDDQMLGHCLLREEAVEGSAATIVLAASFWRSRFKYGHRSSRLVFIEAGHVMQNLTLMSAAVGVAGRPYGGFIDDELSQLTGHTNGVDTAPLYAYVLGVGAD